MRQGRLHLLDAGVQIFDSLPVEESELIHVAEVKVGVGEDALSHVVELLAMMDPLPLWGDGDGRASHVGDRDAACGSAAEPGADAGRVVEAVRVPGRGRPGGRSPPPDLDSKAAGGNRAWQAGRTGRQDRRTNGSQDQES